MYIGNYTSNFYIEIIWGELEMNRFVVCKTKLVFKKIFSISDPKWKYIRTTTTSRSFRIISSDQNKAAKLVSLLSMCSKVKYMLDIMLNFSFIKEGGKFNLLLTLFVQRSDKLKSYDYRVNKARYFAF